MDVSADHPLNGALDGWNAVLEDTRETAAAYRERGWTARTVRPGGVTVDAALPGFDVLVPDDEFRAITDLLAEGVDEYRVFLGSTSGVMFAAVALEQTTTERVALVPLYYRHADLAELREAATDAGHLTTRLRTLDSTSFSVDHERPALFFPDADP